MTFVDKDLDPVEPPHEFRNHEDEAVYKLCTSCTSIPPVPYVSLTLYRLFVLLLCLVDDPELFHGLPVGLQLVGRTLEEEAVIAMTEIVDKALKDSRD